MVSWELLPLVAGTRTRPVWGTSVVSADFDVTVAALGADMPRFGYPPGAPRIVTLLVRSKLRGTHIAGLRQTITRRLQPGGVVKLAAATDTTGLDLWARYAPEGDDLSGDTLRLRFEALDACWQRSDGWDSEQAELAYRVSLSSVVGSVEQRRDGSWVRASGLGGDTLAFATWNTITYAGGQGGLRYRATAWHVPTGGPNGTVNALAAGVDALYVGGLFTSPGANIVKHTGGQAWSPLGTGLNGEVLALAVSPVDGTVYAGGRFTVAGGVTVNRVARWNGSSWEALGTGVNGDVWALCFGPDGRLYVGGTFTDAGGVACSRLAEWDGHVWRALGAFNSNVHALCVGPDGALYVGGWFTAAIADATPGTHNHIACWNGSGWSALGVGTNGVVFALAFDERGLLHVGGKFTEAGDIPCFEGALWNGSAWFPLCADLPGDAEIKAFHVSLLGTLYIGFTTVGNVVAEAVTVVNNVGTAPCPMIVSLRGAGRVYQLRNYTTGKAVTFNLHLLDRERMTLDTSPGRVALRSDVRGSFLHTIVPGSQVAGFELIPGENRIGLLIGDPSSFTTAELHYYPRYYSLEHAWQ